MTSTLLIMMTLVILMLNACARSEPAVDVEAQRTSFAETANAQATMTAEAEPTATDTPEPTQTPTPTPDITDTPVMTPTESNGEAPPPGGGTDRGVVIIQDPPDNTRIRPGDPFTVTWTIENTGTSTWSVNYYALFHAGEQMGAPDKVFVWLPVPPGTSLPISVNFIAPESEGSVTSNWKLVNADDIAFYDFSVTIEVSAAGEPQPATPTEIPEETPDERPTETPTPEPTEERDP